MATAEQVNEVRNTVQAFEESIRQTQLPVAESGAERSISRVVIDMEHYVRTWVEDPPISKSGLNISMPSELGAIIDERLKTAMSLIKATPSNDTWWKSILESKAIQEIGPVATAEQVNEVDAWHSNTCKSRYIFRSGRSSFIP